MKLAVKEFRVALWEAELVSHNGRLSRGIEADVHVIEIALGTHHQHSQTHMEEKNGRHTC